MSQPTSQPTPQPTPHKFADSSVQQTLFRQLLLAMSYPGRVHQLDAAASLKPQLAQGLNSLYAVIATLVDRHVTLADPDSLLPEALWRWLGLSPQAAECPAQAQYIVCDPSLPPSFSPSQGTLASPELGATLIMAVADLSPITALQDQPDQGSADKVRLLVRGPSRLAPKQRGFISSALHPDWLELRNQEKFPLGVDLLFVSPAAVAAVPRSCQLSFATCQGQGVHTQTDQGRAAAHQPERLDP